MSWNAEFQAFDPPESETLRWYVTRDGNDFLIHTLYFGEIVEPSNRDGRATSHVWRDGVLVDITGQLLEEFEDEKEARRYISRLQTVNKVMEL
jgi:hypothetical protein